MMRVLRRATPNIDITLPCSRCGADEPTVAFYLTAASEAKPVRSFYPDLSIRLCKDCLSQALEVIRQ